METITVEEFREMSNMESRREEETKVGDGFRLHRDVQLKALDEGKISIGDPVFFMRKISQKKNEAGVPEVEYTVVQAELVEDKEEN